MSKTNKKYFSKKVRNIVSVDYSTEKLSKNSWSELSLQIASLKVEQNIIKKDLSYLQDFEEKNKGYEFDKTLQRYISENQSVLKKVRFLIRKKRISRACLYLLNYCVLLLISTQFFSSFSSPFSDFSIDSNTYLNEVNDFGAYIIYEFKWFSEFSLLGDTLALLIAFSTFVIPLLVIFLLYFFGKKNFNLTEEKEIRDTSANLKLLFSWYGLSINLLLFISFSALSGYSEFRVTEKIKNTPNIEAVSRSVMSDWIEDCSSRGPGAALHPYNEGYDEGKSNYVINLKEEYLVKSLVDLTSDYLQAKLMPNPKSNEKRKVFCLKNNSTIEAFKTAYIGGRSYSEGILDDLKTSRGSESAFRGLQGKRIEEIKEANRKRDISISQKIINGRFCRNDNCN